MAAPGRRMAPTSCSRIALMRCASWSESSTQTASPREGVSSTTRSSSSHTPSSSPTLVSAIRFPSASGASLVVIYRTKIRPAPFRSIVVYDGGYTMDQANDAMTQTLEGFYQSSATPAARMTHIVGDGQANFDERVLFNNTPIAGPGLPAPAPFVGGRYGPAWDDYTVNVALPADASRQPFEWTTVPLHRSTASRGAPSFSAPKCRTRTRTGCSTTGKPRRRCPTRTECRCRITKAMGADPESRTCSTKSGT